MRVLHINAVADSGSTGRICEEISRRLVEVGEESYLAYSRGGDGPWRIHIGSRFDTMLHALGSRVSGMQGYFSHRATVSLIREIGVLKPDVVHLHNLHSNYINLQLLLRFLSTDDIPTVITLHDAWFMTGKCTHYIRVGCQRWMSECGHCPLLKADNPSWFFDRTVEMKRDKARWLAAIPRLAVVGVSDWITDEARKSHLSNAHTLTRIYNWVDRGLFFPEFDQGVREELGVSPKDTMVIGVASAWSRRKGLDDFIKLAILDPTLKMFLVGVMPDSSVAGLPANIVSLGAVGSPSRLRALYSAADVFVSFSIEETFGLVTVEALACGTPAVVVNATANPELVEPGCGLVVEPSDVEAVAVAIRTLTSTREHQQSVACVNLTATRFDRDRQIDEYIDLYRSLCSETDPG